MTDESPEGAPVDRLTMHSPHGAYGVVTASGTTYAITIDRHGASMLRRPRRAAAEDAPAPRNMWADGRTIPLDHLNVQVGQPAEFAYAKPELAATGYAATVRVSATVTAITRLPKPGRMDDEPTS